MQEKDELQEKEEKLDLQEHASKEEKFSYSKLSTYASCGWQYKLKYIDKNYSDTDSIAADFGTLVHYVEETIAKDVMANNDEPYFMIDDEKYIDIFINTDINDDNNIVLGIKKIKEKYPTDFYVADKSGMNYNEKANDYLNFGIYRLRDYLAINRHLKIIAVEQPFEFRYNDYVFYGYIDRIFKNTLDNSLIIEDIKTWWSIDGHDVVTPLQFVLYTIGCQELYKTDNITCSYDLPLAKDRYTAGTKNFIKRGIKKIDHLLEAITNKNFIPSPSPLCAWCPYSITNPKHIEKDEALCPYHSNWRKNKKDYSTNYEWSEIENHEQIQEDFINNRNKILQPITLNSTFKEIEEHKRIFLGRRN